MNDLKFSHCPVCGKKLTLCRLSCPGCHAEFPLDAPLSPYDYLSAEENAFLSAFLTCRGNLKEVQNLLHISYPTAKRKLDELLKALGFFSPRAMELPCDLSIVQASAPPDSQASQIVKHKLYENGGQAVVHSATGKSYLIRAGRDGKSFVCDQLPITPPYEYTVFDVIVDLLKKQGGKAPKGNGRSFRLGYGLCTEDTVVGTIARQYSGKSLGSSVFDPVFVLAAILEWAGIVHNGRGYLELTTAYCQKCAQEPEQIPAQ